MKRKKALEKLARLAIKSSETVAKTSMEANSVSLSCLDCGDHYSVSIYVFGKDELGLQSIVEDVVADVRKEELRWI